MADPVVTSITAPDVWQLVATNVTTGFIRVVKDPGDTEIKKTYYHTYRDTGNAAPTDIAEGIPFSDDNMKINAVAGIDVYICVKIYDDSTTGSVRLDL